MSGPARNPFEEHPVRLMPDHRPVVDIRYPGGGMQMGFAKHPKTALERLRNLEEWLTADLKEADPELSIIEYVRYVCLVSSVRDRVTQIREQLEG